MTIKDKILLYETLKNFSEEIDCGGNCNKCYYGIEAPGLDIFIQNCPLLVAQDILYDILYKPNEWNRKKG